uniref:Uncharacterized protein n=1 Tax=Choristoneura fumiferana nuclear polyhedrosis virus TaxID=208973 RepID=Q6LCC7_NPVCF|nr:unknown [Choristoneura fumiferana multiple nucleopolyhedrovirus]
MNATRRRRSAARRKLFFIIKSRRKSWTASSTGGSFTACPKRSANSGARFPASTTIAATITSRLRCRCSNTE